MDINCTDHCVYQHDGKCTLNDLPSFSGSVTAEGVSATDCPYFQTEER